MWLHSETSLSLTLQDKGHLTEGSTLACDWLVIELSHWTWICPQSTQIITYWLQEQPAGTDRPAWRPRRHCRDSSRESSTSASLKHKQEVRSIYQLSEFGSIGFGFDALPVQWKWWVICFLFALWFFHKKINSNHLINQHLRIKSTTLPENINHNSKNKTFSHSPICPAFTLNGTSNSLWNTNTHYYISISQPVSTSQSSDWTSSDVCYQKHCGWWHHREGAGHQTHQSILLHLQVLQDYISCRQTQWSHYSSSSSSRLSGSHLSRWADDCDNTEQVTVWLTTSHLLHEYKLIIVSFLHTEPLLTHIIRWLVINVLFYHTLAK